MTESRHIVSRQCSNLDYCFGTCLANSIAHGALKLKRKLRTYFNCLRIIMSYLFLYAASRLSRKQDNTQLLQGFYP